MEHLSTSGRNTIRLRSGLYFNLANPKHDQFTLLDISGALSKICRFGGQINKFYSVAEHSIHCCQQAVKDNLSVEEQLACLFHDATEAFIGDMVKPLKIMIQRYSEIESAIEAVIGEKLGIDFEATRSRVHEIDQAMLIAERRALFSTDKVNWTNEDKVRELKPDIQCLVPNEAEYWFINVAQDLLLTRRSDRDFKLCKELTRELGKELV